MANVTIEINGHKYTVGCDDGQEEHLLRLGRYFDNHVKNLARGVGQIGEQRLFLMAALMIADENYEMRNKLSATEAELMRLKDMRPIVSEQLAKQSEQLNKQIESAKSEAETARNTAQDIELRAVETIDEVTKIFHQAANRLDELSTELNKA